MGSKEKSKNQILDIVESIFGRFDLYIDPFCGSGAMTFAFSEYGNTLSGDVQKYSSDIVNSSFLCCTKKRLFSSLVGALQERVSSEFSDVSKGFPRSIESELSCEMSPEWASRYREALTAEMDACGLTFVEPLASRYLTLQGALWVEAAKRVERDIEDADIALLLRAALLSYVSRNSITTAAQFAQPNLIRSRLRKSDVNKILSVNGNVFDIRFHASSFLDFSAKNDNNFMVSDAKQLVCDFGREGALLYMDPPYGREHYSRFYKVLEFISSPYGTGFDFVDANRHSSVFGLRSQAARELADIVLLSHAKRMPLALSYVSDLEGSSVANRVLSVDQIRSIIYEVYGDCLVKEIGRQNYSSMSVASKDRRSTELLFLGRFS